MDDSAHLGMCLSAAFSLKLRLHVGHCTYDGSGAEGADMGSELMSLLIGSHTLFKETSSYLTNKMLNLLSSLLGLHYHSIGLHGIS